jgi:TPR repeat protein
MDAAVAYARATARPSWLRELYAAIAHALAPFPIPDERPAVVARRLVAKRPRCRARDAADCTRRCSAGDMASCTRAGRLYAERRPRTAEDAGRAWNLLRQACAGGDAPGCAALSQLYVSDDGVRRNVAQAADLAEAACNAGTDQGCAHLAALCRDRLVYPGAGDRCGADEMQRLAAPLEGAVGIGRAR